MIGKLQKLMQWSTVIKLLLLLISAGTDYSEICYCLVITFYQRVNDYSMQYINIHI